MNTLQSIATVTSKGQVLIPVAMRRKLGIKPSDRVIFSDMNGSISLKKASSIDEMYGFIATKQKFTDTQLEKEIARSLEQGISKDI
jgi:AbrB family looped-hinge helix DNA binding protein